MPGKWWTGAPGTLAAAAGRDHIAALVLRRPGRGADATDATDARNR